MADLQETDGAVKPEQDHAAARWHTGPYGDPPRGVGLLTARSVA
ncbi:MAG: hypothetical protein ABSH36_07505 [Solirubrobacteraceae bacterium]